MASLSFSVIPIAAPAGLSGSAPIAAFSVAWSAPRLGAPLAVSIAANLLLAAIAAWCWRRWTRLRAAPGQRRCVASRDGPSAAAADGPLLAALRTSESRQKHLLSGIPAAIFACRASGNFGATFVSENVDQLVGYRAEEFTADPDFWAAHLHPEDAPRVLTALRQIETQESQINEHRFLCKDGVYRWMQANLRLRRDADGRPVECVGVWMNIEERVRAERDLRASEERTRLLVEHSSDAVCRMGPDCSISFISPACRAVLGHEPAELVGTSMLNLCHPADLPLAEAVHEKLLTHAGPQVSEHRFRRSDGRYVWIETYCTALRDKRTGRVAEIIAGLRDVDARKTAADDSRRAEDDLVRAARVAAVGEFAASLAHELNQPLAAIQNFTETARQRLASQPGALSAVGPELEQVSAQARRAGEIIRHLRNFVQTRAPQRVSSSLNDLVRQVLSFLSHHLRQHAVDCRCDLADNLPEAPLDVVQLQQVLVNLLRNAVDAVKERNPNRRRVSVRTERVGDTLRASIADDGPGVAPQVAQTLFDPFVTTKSDGLGLGLAICRSLIEAHHGRLWWRPGAECGAVFGFDLPLSDAEVAHER